MVRVLCWHLELESILHRFSEGKDSFKVLSRQSNDWMMMISRCTDYTRQIILDFSVTVSDSGRVMAVSESGRDGLVGDKRLSFPLISIEIGPKLARYFQARQQQDCLVCAFSV
jgi:hypothetical protein